jgi:2,3-bisphosphoglycerate-independent phosphoglycerate mutase
MASSSLLWIFIDGLGIGSGDPAVNPLARFDPAVLRIIEGRLGPFPRAGVGLVTDPCMGVAGLPQSATGQASMFTGINAPRLVGGHRQGFPDRRLRELVAEASVLVRLAHAGFKVTFANVYTPRFFSERPRWISVTTVMAENLGTPLRNLDDLVRGRGLFMDFSNRYLIQHGFDLPEWSPLEAAGVLAQLVQDHDLCLYEYFLTDLVGHRGTVEEAEVLLRRLDEFLSGLLDQLDLDRVSLLITSDHGNIEDQSVRTHTLNPVPTLAWGEFARSLEGRFSEISLDQVAPLVARFMERDRPPREPL